MRVQSDMLTKITALMNAVLKFYDEVEAQNVVPMVEPDEQGRYVGGFQRMHKAVGWQFRNLEKIEFPRNVTEN